MADGEDGCGHGSSLEWRICEDGGHYFVATIVVLIVRLGQADAEVGMLQGVSTSGLALESFDGRGVGQFQIVSASIVLEICLVTSVELACGGFCDDLNRQRPGLDKQQGMPLSGRFASADTVETTSGGTVAVDPQSSRAVLEKLQRGPVKFTGFYPFARVSMTWFSVW